MPLLKILPLLIFSSSLFSTWTSAACTAPPVALQDMQGNRYYTDEHHSVVDPILKAQNEAAAKPFNDYLKYVSNNSDAWLEKNDKASAICALIWLEQWAQARAMLGHIATSQAHYLRKWTLAGLAFSYLKLKTQATEQQKQSIESWLNELANASLQHVLESKAPRNNHYYWVGLAVMVTSKATNNVQLKDSAKRIFIDALNDIQDDGTLPLEMRRAGKALTYHNYSLAPLVMMAELAKAQHEDWYVLKQYRLDLLMSRVLNGLENPRDFELSTGQTQEIPRGSILGWMLFAQKQRPQFATQMQTHFSEKIWRNPQLGGNLNVLAAQNFFEK
jgi:poly(beta-D-mannuronate) lyase